MKTECPHCGQHYELEEQYLNQIVECERCKQEFVVEPIDIKQELAVESVNLKKKEVVKLEKALSWTGKPDWRVFLVEYFFSALLFLTGIAMLVFAIVSYSSGTRNDLPLIIMGFLFFMALLLLLYSELTRRMTSFTISDGKVRCKFGILTVTEKSIDIKNIRSVNITRSLLDRLVGCGDIMVSSAATGYDANIPIWGIPDYREVAEMLREKQP